MACGLFGKLPAKRDFVAIGAPTAFLQAYERWLQGGLTASRLALGAGWQQAFLNAPIWRFWFGGALCGGNAVAGAFMPSVDGIGRYFPLSIFAVSVSGVTTPPPELDPQEQWFETIEDVLLGALEANATYETVSAQLAALPPPRFEAPVAPPSDMLRLPDATIVSALSPSEFPARLGALRIEDYARTYAHASYLWTLGGPNFEPLVLAGQAMPDPHLFAGLLTGNFDRHAG